MSEFDKLHSGKIYRGGGKELNKAQMKCLDKVYDYNAILPSEREKRANMLKDMFAEIGEYCYIETPFYSSWGGRHVHFGKKIYANFNLTLIDDTHIYVGDYTLFGPNVTVATAAHPIWPEARKIGAEYNKPVHIGSNCWIGAGAVILPGVSIGDNTVIGGGSVVTKDIPSNVVAVGNPCRVLREISEKDKKQYEELL